MGKRGPAPKGEFSGQSAVLSTRIRPDTRASLEDASQKSGRSLSQEIEYRLRRTFIEDEKIADAFGDRRTYLLMRLIALALQSGINIDDARADWRSDPTLFDQAIRSANAVLEAIRPAPRKPDENELMELVYQTRPREVAGRLWDGVRQADPALPISAGTNKQHFFGVLQSELGDLASRPDIFCGTVDQIKQHISDLESEVPAEAGTDKQKRKR